ncbi:MAG: hypothetical protein R3C26_10705 [Calditrichia bacterium]
MKKSITYKDAGVDIDKAEGALNKLKDRIAATYTPEVPSRRRAVRQLLRYFRKRAATPGVGFFH